MNPTNYVENAIVTESRDFESIRSRFTDRNIRLLHAAIGAATEAGELLDAIKKAIFYGKAVDEVNFREEIGDSLWYFAIALDELDSSFQETMDTNIAKLVARYGEKFTAARALKRDLDTERRILEGENNDGTVSIDSKIKNEVYKSLELLGAKSDLLGTVGSWGDSLPDEDVLANLKGWNEATEKERFTAKCPRCGSGDRNVRKEVYSDSSLYDYRECGDTWHRLIQSITPTEKTTGCNE